MVGVLNRWWAHVVFTLSGLPYSVECRAELDPKKQYIFCPNHFSYLDIPTMGLNPHNAIFVGKHDMGKIPLFGYMYRKLHITVDRDKLMSRYSSYKKSQQAIDEGKSLMIFPEGGIISRLLPQMARFKDGAFKLAIEKQIAIVPVTIATNWIVLPDEVKAMTWHPIKLIFHEPIQTNAWPMPTASEDGQVQVRLNTLKEKVFRIIEHELQQVAANLNAHENRKRNIG